ncbi:MAG: hypothetical protein A2381_14740 [Bdellovibrionales bacterium RIFOXYB1_FULL_37_110]|nr:MAG: hypothetical protein A2417_10245 [Bdellovibrionales bacterium RIFOXYC1_FULL_37_79]OFZ60122.1 MAG: hypothetical protein A2381_14740 [Bdellovibrionales bacterium RIFOXYB1_FULL_37_110]OFZ64384.1 MAG: hypothetical protein A2577_10030 [Bdellovibrionales bacterium RIFOXYD1_FULL_36_51]
MKTITYLKLLLFLFCFNANIYLFAKTEVNITTADFKACSKFESGKYGKDIDACAMWDSTEEFVSQKVDILMEPVRQMHESRRRKHDFLVDIAKRSLVYAEKNIKNMESMIECIDNGGDEECEKRINEFRALIQIKRPELRYHLALATHGNNFGKDILIFDPTTDGADGPLEKLLKQRISQNANLSLNTDSDMSTLSGKLHIAEMEHISLNPNNDVESSELARVMLALDIRENTFRNAWVQNVDKYLDAIGKEMAKESSKDFKGKEWLKTNGYLDKNNTLDFSKFKGMGTRLTKMALDFNALKNNHMNPPFLESQNISNEGKRMQSMRKLVANSIAADWKKNRDQVGTIIDQLPVLAFLGKWDKTTPYTEFPKNEQIKNALLKLIGEAKKSTARIENDLAKSKNPEDYTTLLHYMVNTDVVEELLGENVGRCKMATDLKQNISDKEFKQMTLTIGALTVGFLAGGGLLSHVTGPLAGAAITAVAGTAISLKFVNKAEKEREKVMGEVLSRMDDQYVLKHYKQLDEAEKTLFLERSSLSLELLGIPVLAKFGHHGLSKMLTIETQIGLKTAGKKVEQSIIKTVAKGAKKASDILTKKAVDLLINNGNKKFANLIVRFAKTEDQKRAGQILSLLELQAKKPGRDLSKLSRRELSEILDEDLSYDKAKKIKKDFEEKFASRCGCDMKSKSAKIRCR